MSVAEFIEAIEEGHSEIHSNEPEQVIADMLDGIDAYVEREIASLFEAPTETHVILEDDSIPLRHTLIIYTIATDGSCSWRQPNGDFQNSSNAATLKTELLALLSTPEVVAEIDKFIIP